MAKDVIMPALGMAQETGTLLEWLKSEGDAVSKGEPLMTVATDKTDVEIEASADGILTNVTAQQGDEIPVGQVIALILAPGESAPSQATPPASPTPSVSPPSEPAASAQTVPPVSPLAARIAAEHNVDLSQVSATGGRIQKEDVLAYVDAQGQAQAVSTGQANGRILASPKARRLAQEEALDLAQIVGSGPDGAVLAADVMAAAEQAQQTALVETSAQPDISQLDTVPSQEQIPVSRMWQVMAQRLTESWNTVPHFYLEREVNASQLIRWREQAQARLDAKITYTDLLTKLVAAALGKHPRLNASWIDDGIVLNQEINVGLAVAVEEGLLVPVLHQADKLGLGELATRRAEIVNKALEGKLSLDELSNGTFTISNLGMYGITKFNAIVNPPQAAILAVGNMVERVVPVDGQPSVQPIMTLTLSCDHRVVDGARGAQFMQTLVGYLEDPLSLLD